MDHYCKFGGFFYQSKDFEGKSALIKNNASVSSYCLGIYIVEDTGKSRMREISS